MTKHSFHVSRLLQFALRNPLVMCCWTHRCCSGTSIGRTVSLWKWVQGLPLCDCWKQICSQGFWNMLTVLKTHADMIRHLVAATCFEQWMFSVVESDLKNGFHSSWSPDFYLDIPSKVEREEETCAWIPELDSIEYSKELQGLGLCFLLYAQENRSFNASCLTHLPGFVTLLFTKIAAFSRAARDWSHGMKPSWLILQLHKEKGECLVGL